MINNEIQSFPEHVWMTRSLYHKGAITESRKETKQFYTLNWQKHTIPEVIRYCGSVVLTAVINISSVPVFCKFPLL